MQTFLYVQVYSRPQNITFDCEVWLASTSSVLVDVVFDVEY